MLNLTYYTAIIGLIDINESIKEFKDNQKVRRKDSSHYDEKINLMRAFYNLCQLYCKRTASCFPK